MFSIAGSLSTGSHHLLRGELSEHLHLLPLIRWQHRHLLRGHAHHLLQQRLLLIHAPNCDICGGGNGATPPTAGGPGGGPGRITPPPMP